MAKCELDYRCCANSMRCLHLMLAIASVVIGFLRFLDFDIFTPHDIVLSVYIVVLGVVMFFVTCGTKACVQRFRFLSYFFGKGAFDFFMGTAILTITEIWWIITGVLFLIASIICFFLGCIYRKTEKEESEYKEANQGNKDDKSKDNKRGQDYKV